MSIASRDPWFSCEKQPSPMFGLGWIVAAYILSMAFAGLVAPWVYWAIQYLASSTDLGVFKYLACKSFPRYVDRLRYIPILLILPWLLYRMGLFSRKTLGLECTRAAMSYFAKYCIAGVLLLSLVILAQSNTYELTFKLSSASKVASVLLRSVAGGILVAILEEVVFRGLVFRAFYQAYRPWTAILLASAFFAYLHFKLPADMWQPAMEVQWFSGFYVVQGMLLGISRTFDLVPFLSLLVLGMLLCVLYLKTHSLLPGIGFHAGIVMFLLSYKRSFDIQVNPDWEFFLGSGRMTDGLAALIVLIGLLSWQLLRNPHAD